MIDAVALDALIPDLLRALGIPRSDDARQVTLEFKDGKISMAEWRSSKVEWRARLRLRVSEIFHSRRGCLDPGCELTHEDGYIKEKPE